MKIAIGYRNRLSECLICPWEWCHDFRMLDDRGVCDVVGMAGEMEEVKLEETNRSKSKYYTRPLKAKMMSFESLKAESGILSQEGGRFQ